MHSLFACALKEERAGSYHCMSNSATQNNIIMLIH